MVCEACGRSFVPSSRHKKCPSCRRSDRKVLCPVCNKIKINHESLRCIQCQGKNQTGNLNPRWVGGKTYHKKGYVLIHCKDHPRSSNGYVFEHILVMGNKLGRHLLPTERVHHKNGIKHDNEEENLELWTSNHPTGQRVDDLVDWCVKFLNQYKPELLKEE